MSLNISKKTVQKQPYLRKYIASRGGILGSDQALTPAELERFFSMIKSPMHKAMFYLIYSHAMRRSEAAYLKIRDVRFDRKEIVITPFKRKIRTDLPLTPSNRPRVIERLRPLEIKLLQEYLDSRISLDGNDPLFLSNKKGHFHPTRIASIYTKYARQSGLPEEKHHIHCLRHSYGRHSRNNNISIKDTQENMRHATLEVTSKFYYTQTLEEKLAKQDEMSKFLTINSE